MDIFFSQIVNDVPYMAYLQSLYKCRASPEHNLGILLVCAGLNCYVHGYVVLPVGAVTYISKPA